MQDQKSTAVAVEIPCGDASVGVTHGIKVWRSDVSSGITLESTCTVTLSCQQNEEAIDAANGVASGLAEQYMSNNLECLQHYVKDFFGEE